MDNKEIKYPRFFKSSNWTISGIKFVKIRFKDDTGIIYWNDNKTRPARGWNEDGFVRSSINKTIEEITLAEAVLL